MESLNVASFTAFDWFLIALTAISVVTAFRRGIVKVLFSLVGLLASLVIASWTYLRLTELFTSYLHRRLFAEVVSFLLIVVAVNLVFLLVGAVIKKTIDVVGLGFVDRTLGAVFGLLRGILVAIVVLITLAAFLPDSPWIRSSQLAPYFLAGTHAVSFVVPESFRRQITTGLARLLPEQPGLHGISSTYSIR